ncbi:hypothetical protein ACOJBO_00200 [Rhizobium beringeri]
MIKVAGTDGQKAVEAAKGLEWESLRGPVKIDPVSRQVIQNVHIRQVERAADGDLDQQGNRDDTKRSGPGLQPVIWLHVREYSRHSSSVPFSSIGIECRSFSALLSMASPTG